MNTVQFTTDNGVQTVKIAIVDDEIIFAKTFSKTIKEKFPDATESIDVFLSAENFLSAKGAYDIIFMDIEMPRLTGLELAKKHPEASSEIVFVTNRDNLVYEAFNTTKAMGFIRKFKLEDDLNYIVGKINEENQQRCELPVKAGNIVTKIKYSNIIFIEKVAHNAVIHTADTQYSKRTAIAELEELLIPYGFVKSNAGYLLNLSHIKLINPTSALLSNGAVVPISRKNIKQVRQRFLESMNSIKNHNTI